ncbi:MAG: DUF4214 domain-containing protein [Spartobacteria bacterium]|nr:DUF4214 domain-containing protein [Spartobacteria bacterium]
MGNITMKKRFMIYIVALSAFLAAGSLCARADQVDTVISRAYEDLLNRKPDPSGLRRYHIKMIDDGWSEEDVRKDIRSSQEYRGKGVDDVIRRAYEDLLDRKADSAGFNFYKKQMIDKGWSERDVRDALRNSEEYKKKHR